MSSSNKEEERDGKQLYRTRRYVLYCRAYRPGVSRAPVRTGEHSALQTHWRESLAARPIMSRSACCGTAGPPARPPLSKIKIIVYVIQYNQRKRERSRQRPHPLLMKSLPPCPTNVKIFSLSQKIRVVIFSLLLTYRTKKVSMTRYIKRGGEKWNLLFFRWW
jgi:hypothetical protein